MRFFFVFMLLVGIATGIAYPWYARNSRQDIGSYQAFDGSSFNTVTVGTDAPDSPVEVFVDLTTGADVQFAADATVLTLTATLGGRTVLAETLTFAGAEPRLVSPQSPERIYRTSAGTIDPTEKQDAVFQVGQGDAEGIDIRNVEIILKGAGITYDERAQPLGFSLIAIGFVGSMLAFRRRREATPPNKNSQPPPPKWGRGSE